MLKYQYHHEIIPMEEIGSGLNEQAKEGWKLHTILPGPYGLARCIFERPNPVHHTLAEAHPVNCACAKCWQQMEAGGA